MTALVELVHAVEQGKSELGWHNLDALVAVDAAVGSALGSVKLT